MDAVRRASGADEDVAKVQDPYLAGLVMPPVDEDAARRARERWDSIAKPVGSLGDLEDVVVRIAALGGSEQVDVGKRCVVTLCADNGVAAQGVSQSGADVTLVVAANVARGISSVCCMCEAVGASSIAVDVGMFERLDVPGLIDRRIAAGTGDISQGPAMTRAQVLQAVRTGVELVGELVEQGYRLIGTGEMGIGNTTTSTAVACALTGLDPELLTGRGSGLSDAGRAHKVEVVRRALAVNAPEADDPLDVLAKVGGFDIATMCGMFLGGAVYRVPVLIDGFISTVAAYCAWQLRSECLAAMLASHLSAEPGAAVLLERMGLRAPVHAGMRLGEGTGTTCLMALLDVALALYRTGPTFADCGITSYKVAGA